MSNLKLDLVTIQLPLDVRIDEFKSDDDKMKDVNDFINEIVEKAKVEVENRKEAEGKAGLDAFGLQNGGKKIGASLTKAKTSARTFATRVFTAICNCTNSVKSAVVNRN
ncbi:uncharacterized protein [Atheta coriaria]|uniref:uncharacterized protein n=1 Tax=Dalotia coriaria TaxID=877792 RepID=UPI0031F3820C